MQVEDYRGQAAAQGHPLFAGEEAIFLWFGPKPPVVIGDFTHWEYGQPLGMQPVGPEVWAARYPFAAGAYLEYAFWDGSRRLADPLNPRTTPDGFGNSNHYFYMPGGGPSPLAQDRSFPRGQVSRHEISGAGLLVGKTRPLYLYQPPVDEACPLWVVWDGRDYLQRGMLVNIVDALIGQGRIRPVALALLHHAGSSRLVEYGCSDATLAFTLQELIPFARARLKLIDPAEQPGAYGVMGASMGGLMALYTGLRAPDVFGSVLSQSGAFHLGDSRYRPVVYDLLKNGPAGKLNIHLAVGRYEWLLEANRDMRAALDRHGYAPGYHEFLAGHNYPAWRDDLAQSLEAVLGASPGSGDSGVY